MVLCYVITKIFNLSSVRHVVADRGEKVIFLCLEMRVNSARNEHQHDRY